MSPVCELLIDTAPSLPILNVEVLNLATPRVEKFVRVEVTLSTSSSTSPKYFVTLPSISKLSPTNDSGAVDSIPIDLVAFLKQSHHLRMCRS